MTCIDCREATDVPVFRGEGFHQEGPFCARCAQERANVEIAAQRERDTDNDLRELEMNRAMWEREAREKAERIERQINSWRERDETPPNSAYR